MTNFDMMPIREKLNAIINMRSMGYSNDEIASRYSLGSSQRVSQYLVLKRLLYVPGGDIVFGAIDARLLSFDRVRSVLQSLYGREELAKSVDRLLTEAEARERDGREIGRGYNPALGRRDGRRRSDARK